MPAEIADSDAESDCASPRRPPVSPIITPDIETRQLDPSEPDPVLDLQFSQFLSPTQRLSSAIQQQEEVPPRSSGSTDRFLREIHNTEGGAGTSIAASLDNSVIDDTSPPVRHKPKRRFSDIEQSTSSPLDGDHTQRKQLKKAKTYGSSRSIRGNPLSSIVEQNSTSVVGDQHDGISAADEMNSSGQPAQDMQQQSNWSVNPFQSNGPNKNTRDSMHSGYHGMTLDFRNGNSGLDIDTNPFGSLSQVSFDGDIDSMEVQRFTNLFTGQHNTTKPVDHPAGARTSTISEVSRARESSDLIQHTASTNQANTNQKIFSTEDIPQPPDMVPNGGHVSAPDPDSVEDRHACDDIKAPEDSIVVSKTTKKRSRKSKNKKADHEIKKESDSMEDQEMSSDGGNKSNGQKSIAKSVCVDEENVQSETSSRSKGTKRRKKGTEKSKVPDTSPIKNVSSELGLNDPNLVGMPKEIYHVKPSRSRSRRQVDKQEDIESTPHALANQSLLHTVGNDLVDQSTDTVHTAKSTKRKGKPKGSKQPTSSGGANTKHDAENEDHVSVLEESAEIPADSSLPANDSGTPGDQKDPDMSDTDAIHDEVTVQPTSENKIMPKFSVDSPPYLKSSEPHDDSSKSRLNKRGRKSKKMTKMIDDDLLKQGIEPDNISKEDNELFPPGRPALEEVDANPGATSFVTRSSNSPSAKAAPEAGILYEDDENNLDNQISAPEVSTNPIKDKSSFRNFSTSTLTAHSSSSSSTNLLNHKSRIGLSRKIRIPSLLRKLDRTKEPPKVHERKEKLTKRQQEAEDKRRLEAEDGGDDSGTGMWSERGADGMLLEWND